MRFKWVESTEDRQVSFSRLYSWRPKVLETIQNIQNGKLSYTEGSVTVSRLDSPRGAFFVLDGHHRVIEAILAGQKSIPVTLDQYTTRIERTGGAHQGMVEDKVLIIQAVKEVKHGL